MVWRTVLFKIIKALDVPQDDTLKQYVLAVAAYSNCEPTAKYVYTTNFFSYDQRRADS